MSTTPTTPDFRPKPQRERAKAYQLEAVAQLSVLGTHASTIAAVTELTEPYINRLLSGGNNQTFDDIREKYRQQNMKLVTGAHFKLVDMLPEVDTAIQNALGANDLRLAAETAWKIRDKVIPDMVNNNRDPDSFQITINQPHVQAKIGETMTDVAEALSLLKSVIQSQDPGAHIMVGVEALPIPPSQLEVSEGEASLEPTEGPDDLLLELMEHE